jgi:hypothetical protein
VKVTFNTGNTGDAQLYQPDFTGILQATGPPDDVELLDNGQFMFKQDSGLFKQVWEGGKVVGLLYQRQRPNGAWTALGEAQVKSRYEIYRRRAADDGSETARRGATCWGWALSLFRPVEQETEIVN